MEKVCRIAVIGFRGEKISLDVANSEEEFNQTTISVFKEKLAAKYPEVKDAQFRVIFSGKLLEDTDTFATYNIQPGSAVHLILRMPGGGCGPLEMKM